MKRFAMIAAATAVLTLGGASAAFADDCSGHNHDTGTVLGAAGGAAIGGLASHSIAGALVGGVVGGVAGNAIARDNDCNGREAEARANDRAYDEGYQDRAAEDHEAMRESDYSN